MKKFVLGVIVGIMLSSTVAYSTPFPSIDAQFDLDGNCVVNFPGDTIYHAKVTLGVEPMPTWLPTCPQWYATATPTP